MPLTQAELTRFQEFAQGKMANGGVGSLEECVRQWRQEEETAATIAAVRRGEADMAAGRYSTIEEAEAQIRQRLNLPPANDVS